MNILAPVASIMSKSLITVNPEDKLTTVKNIFDTHSIHHLPVVRYKQMVGMISASDMLYFLRGFTGSLQSQLMDEARLQAFRAEDIMTTGLAKLSSKDSIRTALDVFKVNRFHALPVIDEDELVGILTTYDIIKALAETPISLDDYKDQ